MKLKIVEQSLIPGEHKIKTIPKGSHLKCRACGKYFKYAWGKIEVYDVGDFFFKGAFLPIAICKKCKEQKQ